MPGTPLHVPPGIRIFLELFFQFSMKILDFDISSPHSLHAEMKTVQNTTGLKNDNKSLN